MTSPNLTEVLLSPIQDIKENIQQQHGRDTCVDRIDASKLNIPELIKVEDQDNVHAETPRKSSTISITGEDGRELQFWGGEEQENTKQIKRGYLDDNCDYGIEDFIEVTQNKAKEKSKIREHNLTDEKKYSLVNSRMKMLNAGRIVSGQCKTDDLKEVISRVANVTKSLNMSWEKLSSRHFKNEIILPLMLSDVLPKKKGLKDYSSVWNKRVQAIYQSYLEENDDWEAEFTSEESDLIKKDLRVIRDSGTYRMIRGEGGDSQLRLN